MSIMELEFFLPFVEGLDHPEGVAWGPDGYVYAGGEAGQLYRVRLEDGAFQEIATTGGFLLGLCLDASANVYACDLGQRAVMRITQEGEVSVYSAGAPDRKMMSPNYPVFGRAGNLYVSDSGRWDGSDGCLFRIWPGGEAEVATDRTLPFPNGLALSPDGRHLYVALSNLPGVVRAEIDGEGQLGPLETVVEMPRTVPDGLAFDTAGNLYISCYTPDQIYRLTPEGELALLVEDWRGTVLSSPTNIAFCGPDLLQLVTANLARWHLTRAWMPVAGSPLFYPDLHDDG
jgi:gluconolactonase